MKFSRLIKTTELFYKRALWSYFMTKSAASDTDAPRPTTFVMPDDDDDDDDDLLSENDKLENLLKNPDTFMQGLEELLDLTADTKLHNLFTNSDEFAMGPVPFLEKINEQINSGDLYNLIRNKGGNVSTFKQMLKAIKNYLSGKTEDQVLEAANFPKYMYEIALNGLDTAMTEAMDSMLHVAAPRRTQVSTPINLEELSESLDEIGEEDTDSDGPSESQGQSQYDPTNPAVAKFREEKLAKIRDYRKNFRDKLKEARKAGDPEKWTPETRAGLEKNPARLKELERQWQSLQKFEVNTQAAKANFRNKILTDPEFAEKARAKGRERQANYVARLEQERSVSQKGLFETSQKVEELNKQVLMQANRVKAYMSDMDREPGETDDQFKARQAQETKLMRNTLQDLEDKLESTIYERNDWTLRLNAIEKKLNKSEHRNKESLEVADIKQTRYPHPTENRLMDATEMRAFVANNPSYTARYFGELAITDWAAITHESEGWLEHLRQNINNERSEIVKALKSALTKFLSENEVKTLAEQLQEQGFKESLKGKASPPPYEIHKNNVQSAIIEIRKMLESYMSQSKEVATYGEMYAESLRVNFEFRRLVKLDMKNLSSMNLDDPDVVLSSAQLEKIKHIYRESEKFNSLINDLENDNHKQFLKTYQQRILREFLAMLRGLINRLEKNMMNAPISEAGTGEPPPKPKRRKAD